MVFSGFFEMTMLVHHRDHIIMSNIKNFSFIFLLISFTFQGAFAQTKFVNEFLNIGVGARAHGMFHAQVATVDDVSAALWNPAGLSRIDAPLQVSAMHAEWFGGVANYDYLGLAKSIDKEKESYGAISIIRMGIDNIPYTLNLIGPDGSVNYDNVSDFSTADYAFFGSYGQKIGEFIRVGGSAKVIYRSIGRFANAWGFGMDLGANYELPRFTFGLTARDITTTYNSWSFNLTDQEKLVFSQTGNSIPETSSELVLPRVILGAAFHNNKENYLSKYTYTIEMNLNINTDGRASGLIATNRFAIEPVIGGEFGYADLVFVRAGIGNMQRLVNDFNADTRSLSVTPALGLGLKLNRFRIDYALNNIGSSAGTGNLFSHIFSLSIDFQPKSKSTL